MENQLPLEVEMTEQQMKIQFNAKMFALQQFLDEYPFLKDGYNDAQKYEYVKANQYRNALRRGAIEHRLRLKVNIANRIHEDLPKSDKMHLTTIQGSITLVDIDTGYEESTYMMADGADNLDKGIYKAMTMFIKSFVQTTFLISDENEDDPQAGSKAPEVKPARFNDTAKKREKAKQQLKEEKMASANTIHQCMELIQAIRTVDPGFGKKAEEILDAEDEKGHPAVSAKIATKYLMQLEAKADELGVI